MARFGKIGDSYLDDAGDPLISGKLFFYESGTNTNKNTYADVNLSIVNTNPVILTAAGRQPNIFFNGTARVILTKSDNTQIQVRDPEGGEFSEGVFSTWNSLTIYNTPDIVTGSDGNFYISITSGSQGEDPISTPTAWSQIRFVRVWNSNETYSLNQVVEGSDALLYSSLSNGNLNNDPTSDPSKWKPATEADIPPVIRAAAKQFAYSNF